MVYLQKGSKTFKLRIVAPDGRSITASTGCKADAREDADAIEVSYKVWRGDKGERFAKPELLTAIVDKRITLRAAWEASLDGTLQLLLAEAPAAAPAPRSLAALPQEWCDWKTKQKKGAKSARDYLRQLKTLFPEIDAKKFTIAHFTRVELAKRLDALEVDAPTKNRYKLAASGFAKYLVRRGILETNFVRDIEGFGENDPRKVYYPLPEAKRLIAGLAQPWAGAAAMAYAFCMEEGGIEAAMVRDVDLAEGDESCFVRGTKTVNRERTVRLVEENRWLLPYIKAAIAGKSPNAKIFPDIKRWTLLREQRKVATALEVKAIGEEKFGQHTFHDWRRTRTVQLLRDGYEESVAAHDLGHEDVNLVHTTYGDFIVEREDYRRKRTFAEQRPAASSATTLQTPLLRATK